jgi:polysaccharide export outer membrane protein
MPVLASAKIGEKKVKVKDKAPSPVFIKEKRFPDRRDLVEQKSTATPHDGAKPCCKNRKEMIMRRYGPFIFLITLVFFGLFGCAASDKPFPAMPKVVEDADSEAYVIGPEDVLEISVWQNPDLSRTVTVRPDGRISLPLINDIHAAGLTPEKLKQVITERLKPFIETSDVAVIVQQINSWRVYVQGEVNSPGIYPFRSRISLSQAISMAGGFTEFAKKSRIQILRKQSSYTEVITVNYDDIMSGISLKEDLLLRPGDTIIVL